MDLEFGEFDVEPKPPKHNMEDILKKDQEFNIDWDNFQNPNKSESMSKSQLSGIFNKQNQKQNAHSGSNNFQVSRSISEISYVYGEQPSQSFRFQTNDSRQEPSQNQRYAKMQRLLTKAKQNGMGAFYRNLDEMNKNNNQSKFQNYEDFQNYVRNLKSTKKNSEQSYENKFKSRSREGANKLFGIQQNPDFRKKPEKFLPPEFENFEEDEENDNPFSSDKFVNKQSHDNFFRKEETEYNQEEDAANFLDFQYNKKEKSQKKERQSSLKPIREEKDASFQKSFEEQKLNNLFNSYQTMKIDFDKLMMSMKQTYEGQQIMVKQLQNIKQSWHEQQKKEVFLQKQQRKEKFREQKNQQLESIKNQIKNIKNNDRDIVYVKMSEKIEHLEGMLTNALKEVNEEKEKKLQPKIINYFCEPKKVPKKQYTEEDEFEKISEKADFSREEFTESPQKVKTLEEQKRQFESRELKKVYRKKESPKFEQKFHSSRARSNFSYEQKEVHVKNDFTSPLQLNLSHVEESYINEVQENIFEPSQIGKEYTPKDLTHLNKNLRNCLTQKNSIVYESFQFTVAAKFTMIDNPLHPIEADIRVGNKCSIDLSDVFLIIYGPQGPGLITEPGNIYHERVKKNTNFTFQVYINKDALDDNGFSIQISYKTESTSKKKLNFKVTLPTLQLIRPEFIYEQQFIEAWNSLTGEFFIKPKRLDETSLRSHEDLKIVLPFIDINESDGDTFAYGLVFRYPCSQTLFMIKLECSVYGKGFLQLRYDKIGDKKLKQQLLDVLNFIFFSPLQ